VSTVLYSARYLLPICTPPIENGALIVRDGRILAVGRLQDLQLTVPGAERFDYADGVLLPPMVNAHIHLELSDFPIWREQLGETTEPDDLVAWIEQVIRIKQAVDPDCFASAISHGISASLSAGTGAVGEVLSQFPARMAHRSSPLYGRLFFEAIGRLPELFRSLRLKLEELLGEGACGRLQPGLAPHAPYTLAAEFLRELFQFAKRHNHPCTMHLAESAEERRFLHDGGGPIAERLYPRVGWGDDIPPGSGRSPVAWLDALGGVAPWNLLVHGVQVDEEDLRLIATSGATVVFCPRSNARLKVGSPPLSLYRATGVKLALGTDSLASNDSLSLWDEIAFAWPEFSRCYTASEMLRLATCNGAEALGLHGEMGELRPGSGAHFQVLQGASGIPLAELPESLCRQAAGIRVAQLILSGKECLPFP